MLGAEPSKLERTVVLLQDDCNLLVPPKGAKERLKSAYKRLWQENMEALKSCGFTPRAIKAALEEYDNNLYRAAARLGEDAPPATTARPAPAVAGASSSGASSSAADPAAADLAAPDLAAPAATPSLQANREGKKRKASVDPVPREVLTAVCDMGFELDEAKTALEMFDNNIGRAVNYLATESTKSKSKTKPRGKSVNPASVGAGAAGAAVPAQPGLAAASVGAPSVGAGAAGAAGADRKSVV